MWFCPTLHIKGMGEEDKNLPIKTVFQEMVSGLALQFYTEFMTSRIVIEDMIHPHPVLAQKIVLGENVFLALQLSRIKCILLTSSLFLAMQGRTFLRFQARSISLQCFCNYGKIGQKRAPGKSPFSCLEEKSDHYCSSQHYHSTQGCSFPTLLSTFRHHSSNILFAFLCFDIQCTLPSSKFLCSIHIV